MNPSQGIEPAPYWWMASPLIPAPSLLPSIRLRWPEWDKQFHKSSIKSRPRRFIYFKRV